MDDKTKSEIRRLYLLKSPDGKRKFSWQQMADIVEQDKYTVRDHAKQMDYYEPERPINHERLEILSDGQRISERILALTAEQLNSPEELLKAHGFSPDEWSIDRATSNLWHGQREGELVPLYQSKIHVKPNANPYRLILSEIKTNAVPFEIEPEYEEPTTRNLVVNINDTHFGANSYGDYIDSQQVIINQINQGYHTVVINLAGDLLETDNFKHTTASGTRLDNTNLTSAWADLTAYVEPIVMASIRSSRKVRVIYLRGNHSESMEWAFVQYLKARFPQVQMDDSIKYHKAILLGKVFLGFSHGYKNSKNLPINFAIKEAKLWGQAEHREIISAHNHRESTLQGAIHRILPTRAKEGEYVEENNFVSSHKSFQLFEYSTDNISAIYYV